MNQTALITGASSGIGRALAVEFAEHGYNLILVARHQAALEETARTIQHRCGVEIQTGVIAADLSESNSARMVVARLDREVDVLVNSAGVGVHGEFAALALDRQVEMIQLNVVTVTELTGLLLPGMLTRGRGGVLNVASTAAFQPGPLMAVYYASKAYVLSFTEAIAEESTGTGVRVTCLCPGPTDTRWAERADALGTNLFRRTVMTAEAVAREGFNGWRDGKVIVIPGAGNRRGAVAIRVLPRAFIRRVVKRLNSRP